MSRESARKVSVIVPCYNVESFVDDCVRSAVAQADELAPHALEVVLVDDGSTDGTPMILDRWSDDPTVVVVRQANTGLGGARNAGIAAAQGDYLFFLDGDDELPTGALRRLLDSLRLSGSSFASGVAWRFDSTGRWRTEQYRGVFDVSHRGTHLFREPQLVYDQMACSKLFDRSFWDSQHLCFPTGTLYEDVGAIMRAHATASAVDIVSDCSYLWRRRESHDTPSITQDRYRRGSAAARFAALHDADLYLRDNAPEAVWAEHGVKVMTVDIRMYSRLLREANDGFVTEFLDAARPLVSDLAPAALDRLNPVMRQLREYVVQGSAGGSVAMTKLMSGSSRRNPGVVMSGLAWLARHDPRALARIGRESLHRS